MELEKKLNDYIDHTLLRPAATHEEFESFLDGAVKYSFAAVCVPPHMAYPVKLGLQGEGSKVKVCTVVGFPHGTLPVDLKLREVDYHARNGIDELDFVINYGDLKSGRYDSVGREVELIGHACKKAGIISKCIIETCYLDRDEITFMYRLLAEHSEVDYIKTSTGFGTEGADINDVLNWDARRREALERLAERKAGPISLSGPGIRTEPLKIKAAGGIKDLATALRFIAAGADRLGTSSGVKIMEEYHDAWLLSNSKIDAEREEEV